MHDRTLRPTLLLNAAFSGANGLLLALAPSMVATWLGPPATWVYALLGVGLLLFCLTLGAVAAHPTPLAVLLVTGADLGWVLSTMTALLVWRGGFTPLGVGMVIGTNAVVSTFAWLQLRAAQESFHVPGGAGDEYELCVAVHAPVEAERFWGVLADMGSIERYLPALRSSRLTVGEKPGIGCVRTCENVKGQVWSEKCDEWEEGRAFGVVFLADAPGFPYPFSKMRGGWRVAPDDAGCRVEVWWRVVPRQPWLAPLLLPLMAAAAQRDFPAVIARMTLAAQGLRVDRRVPPALPRLRAALC